MPCKWKHLLALQAKTLFEKKETTLAVPTFLWEAEVGQMVSLAALGRGRGVEVRQKAEGKEGGPARP